jgi:hypothetical protein
VSHSPLPSVVRRYFKGYNREQDEEVAKVLFYGTLTFNEKTRRWRRRYLTEDSSDERRGFEALRRLLFTLYEDLDSSILAALACSLDPNSSSFERRLVFKFRKKGNRRDTGTDQEVADFVATRRDIGRLKNESAIQEAMTAFHLSRSAVFKAIDRAKRRAAKSLP